MNGFTDDHWRELRHLWARAHRTSIGISIATTNEDGSPHLAPIGSISLSREPGEGYLLEMFTRQTSKNLDRDPRVAVMAIDSSMARFVNALRKGRFEAPMATRLTGTVGPRRRATEVELAHFQRKVRPLRRLKGHDLLWNVSNCFARSLHLDVEHPVRLGAMTKQLERPTTAVLHQGASERALADGA